MKQRIQLETSYPRIVKFILILSSLTFKYTSFLLHATSQNKPRYKYSTFPTPTPLKLHDYEVGTLRLM
jgi:hypothetical protein